jgi:hypothetical protein
MSLLLLRAGLESSDAPVTPAVAVRALSVLFVAFSCSSWPSSCADHFGENGKNMLEKMLGKMLIFLSHEQIIQKCACIFKI